MGHAKLIPKVTLEGSGQGGMKVWHGITIKVRWC